MDGDIEVAVAHLAPVLLRGRRGAAPVAGVARLTTPARIRRVSPAEMTNRRAIEGAFARINGGLVLFEGRLWRPASGQEPWGLARDASAAASPEALARALACADSGDPADGPLRRDLWQLSLDPWRVTNQYGRMGEHARVLDGTGLDPDKLALDLRAECAAAVARRVGAELVHDGRVAWIAVPHPTLRSVSVHPDPIVVEPPVQGKLPLFVTSLPGEIESYFAYEERSRGGPLSRKIRTETLAAAEQMSRELDGVSPDPYYDVARAVRRFAIVVDHACRGILAARRPQEDDPVTAPLLALAPVVARATADLIEPADLPQAVDRIVALAERARVAGENLTGSHGLYRVRDAIAYAETVARPRFARAPTVESDLDALGGLVR